MKRRILLGIFATVTSAITVYFALWYSGFLEERECLQSGGTWVAVRKMCTKE